MQSSNDGSAERNAARTEEELLEGADRRARAALVSSTRGLGEDVLDALDLRRHVERHPLASLAAGVVGGLLLARPIERVVGRGPTRAILGSVAKTAARFAEVGVLGNVVRAFLSTRRPPF